MQAYGVLYGTRVVLEDGTDVTNRDLVGEGFSEYRRFLYGTDDLRRILARTTALWRFRPGRIPARGMPVPGQV